MVSSEESPFIDVKGHFFTMVELKSYRHALLRENRACSCFECICLLCILCTMFALRQPSFFIPFGLLVSGVLLSFLSTLFKRDIGFIIYCASFLSSISGFNYMIYHILYLTTKKRIIHFVTLLFLTLLSQVLVYSLYEEVRLHSYDHLLPKPILKQL